MNEKYIVQYHNDLNNIRLKDFTSKELDIFMYLCCQLRNLETNLIEFDFNVIKRMTGIDKLKMNNDDFADILYHIGESLTSIKLAKNRNSVTKRGCIEVLFYSFEVIPDEKKVNIRVNKKAVYLLNNLIGNFTIFEYQQFISLKSKYAKNLFRLLVQYRNIGSVRNEVEYFRKIMDCPEKYDFSHFKEKCIVPAMEEIKDLRTESGEKVFYSLEFKGIPDRTNPKKFSEISFSFKTQKWEKENDNSRELFDGAIIEDGDYIEIGI